MKETKKTNVWYVDKSRKEPGDGKGMQTAFNKPEKAHAVWKKGDVMFLNGFPGYLFNMGAEGIQDIKATISDPYYKASMYEPLKEA